MSVFRQHQRIGWRILGGERQGGGKMSGDFPTLAIVLLIGYALAMTAAFALASGSGANQPTIQIRQEPDAASGCLIGVLAILFFMGGLVFLLSR